MTALRAAWQALEACRFPAFVAGQNALWHAWLMDLLLVDAHYAQLYRRAVGGEHIVVPTGEDLRSLGQRLREQPDFDGVAPHWWPTYSDYLHALYGVHLALTELPRPRVAIA